MSDYLQDSEFMSFQEKDNFWKKIYGKIESGIKNKSRFVILFGLQEIIQQPDPEDSEYSIVIESSQYQTFLENYILWHENLEDYERCGEAKQLIGLLKEWEDLERKPLS